MKARLRVQQRIFRLPEPTDHSALPPGLRAAMEQTAAYLRVHGSFQADAVKAASARYNEQLIAQARLLGFMDCFHLIGLITLAVAPLVLMTKGFKNAGKSPPAHEEG